MPTAAPIGPRITPISPPTLPRPTRNEARHASLPHHLLQLPDPIRRFSLVLLDDFLPASDREENRATAFLLQLSIFYANLGIDGVAGDTGLGYDDEGRPICPFGYAFRANGFDFHRRSHKWACLHTWCSGTTPIALVEGATYPRDECSYLDHAYGQLIDVGEHFKDHCIRLVGDISVGAPAWKRLYHRARNAAGGRNSAFGSWDLKRLSVYGDLRGKALIFQAGVWLNLTTLAWLIRGATAATGV